jgi:hypothetical protein
MANLVRRLILLVFTLGVGLAIGWFGQWLTGEAAWFLAIPGALAIVWFRVADTRLCLGASCLAPDRSAPNKKPVAGSPPTTGS